MLKYFFIIIILFFCGCTVENINNSDSQTIQVEHNEGKIKYSENITIYFTSPVSNPKMEQEKTTNIEEVLQFCSDNNLPARVVGQWVWIKFPSKPNASIREKLEQIGFRWSSRRRQYHHNCGYPSELARDYEPWDRYSTQTLEDAFQSNR